MITEKDLADGRRFRVIKAGGQLHGLKPTAPYCQTGWAKPVEVGTVLTCAGRLWTQGDGVPVIKWKDANGCWIANDCEFEPSRGSMWHRVPDLSFFEEVKVYTCELCGTKHENEFSRTCGNCDSERESGEATLASP